MSAPGWRQVVTFNRESRRATQRIRGRHDSAHLLLLLGDMRLRMALTRCLPLIPLGSVCLIAYLQATGVNELLWSRVEAWRRTPTFPMAGAASGAVRVRPRDAKSADPILARNAFDSAVGPLRRPRPRQDGGKATLAGFEHPFDAPLCADGLRAVIIAASLDAPESMAALTGPGRAQKTQLRRIGDVFGDKRVWHISQDRVWLADAEAVCQLQLHGGPAVVETSSPGTQSMAREWWSDQIEPLGETVFRVDRALVEALISDPAKARVVARAERGGIRLLGIRDATLASTLGLRSGDRLERVNGFALGDPRQALEAVARVSTAQRLRVELIRDGTPITLDYDIR